MRRNHATNPRKAPPVIALKAPRLDASGLEEAYEWMPADKTTGFRLAFDWWKINIEGDGSGPSPLLWKDPLDADRQRSYDRAVKAQKLGDSSPIEGEKIQAWSTAIHLFERVWAARPIPKLDEALAATVPGKSVACVQGAVQNLNDCYSSCGLKFRLSFQAERDFDDREMMLALPKAEALAMAALPPIQAVLSEAKLVAQLTSFAQDEQGQLVRDEQDRPVMDPNRFDSRLTVALTAVAAWVVANDGRVAKAIGKPNKVRHTNVNPAAASTPRVKSNVQAIDPFGLFRPNTCKAGIAAVLADGSFHLMENLRETCRLHGMSGYGQIKVALAELAAKGFKVEQGAGGVRVTR